MYRVGINFDEISDDLVTAIKVMKGCDVQYGELRTIGGKNFVFWTDEEVAKFKQEVVAAGIELVAAATPLFKWYEQPDAPEIRHDSFGFDPRLDEQAKRQIIDRAIAVAAELGIPRLRIFSVLGRQEDAGRKFAQSELLAYALDAADRAGIDLYLENEPVCRVHDQKQIEQLLEAQTHPRLKLWLDIANMLEINEEIDTDFLKRVGPRLGHVHLKDFKRHDDGLAYVPVGDGVVPFGPILDRIDALKVPDLVFTVETHAKALKVEASVRSVLATQELVAGLKG
jgi:sugar phosphate isomerase/epimerase